MIIEFNKTELNLMLDALSRMSAEDPKRRRRIYKLIDRLRMFPIRSRSGQMHRRCFNKGSR